MSTPVVIIPPAGDVQVNSFATGLQLLPSVATLPGGGWIVSWTSGNQDGNGFGVYAQRYDAAGVAVGGEVLVNTQTTGDQQISSVETLPDGGWIVSWTSGGQDGDGFGTYLQRYDSAGAAVGGEVQVNTFATGDQFLTKMAALPDGGWIVTWTSVGQDGDFGGVYQQRYDAAGAAVGAEVQVNTETVSNQDASCVAALSDGGWVVTWQSFAQDGDSSGIYAQRYDSTGVAVGGEVQVNTTVAGSQRLPSVTALSDGGYAVSWTSVSQEELGGDVYLQRYDASGAAVGGEVRVNTYTSGDQSFSSMAALADGGFVVSWTSAGQDGDGGGIFLQRYDAGGVAVGGEVQVNTTTAGHQFQTTVAALADGGFVVSWSSDGQDGNSFGVFQKVFNADGSERPGAVYVENAAAVAVAPGLAVTDIDSTLLAGATVTVTDHVAGEDLLSFVDQGGIKGSWDPVSGTLTLTGSATLDLYEAALRSVAYTNISDSPTGTGRTIAFQVDDGAAADNLSVPVNAQVTIFAVNDAPVVSIPLADQASAEDATVNFVLPAGSFTDLDGDALTLTAELSDGSVLPAWLSFDVVARSFTGTPPVDFNGVLDVRVTASDGALEVSDSFALTITPVNDAPVVNAALADQASTEAAAVNFVLPAGSFTDVDGDALTLTASLSNGTALPAWLSFDAAARSFTGTPPSEFNGVLDVRVTASDGVLAVSDTFALTITSVNDAPVVSTPLADEASTEDSAVSFILPAGSFTDVDGDALTLTADLSDGATLPAWLRFDAAARSFTGTPPLDFNGVLDVRVTASDGALEVSDTFALTITPENDAPVVSTPLTDQASAEDAAVSFILPAGSFTDVDGDTLTLTAELLDGSVLPSWLSFDAAARSFTGTPPVDFNGVLDVRVTASDGALAVSDSFALTITPVNDAPVVSVPLLDQASAEDAAVNFVLPADAFTDVDGDALILTAALSDGATLPAWLRFDAAARSFTGTPPLDFNGVLDVRVTASDGALEVSDTFALTIIPVNDPPVVSTPLADQASAEDTAVNFALPAGAFADVDGDTLTLMAALPDGSTLPEWLSFDTAARSFTGTPPSDFNGVLDVRVTASDGALAVSDSFALTITPVNDAPVVSVPLLDQASAEDAAVNFVLPADAFTDVDGDALTLTAELSDGSVLPAWLSFDAVARSFTGTPPLDFNGVLDVRVTASDGALEVSDTFALTITPVNDAPVASAPLADQASAEDTAVNFALPAGAFADVDGDTLTLTAALPDGSTLPEWLSFDTAARSFTGTPPSDFNGVLDVRVTASDGALEVSDTFALTITPVNDAPVVSTPLADQASAEDTAVNFALPAGAFADVDGDTLTLTAALPDGSALPAWLSFDATARSFTGTPPLDFNGVLDVRVTASDGALEVSDSFALTIAPVNDAPVASAPLADQASAEDTAVNFVLPADAFTDVDGDALTLTAGLSDGSALPGWLSFDTAARSFTGTPPSDFNGVLDVRVTASDGALEVSDSFALTVTAVNDVPVVSVPLVDQASEEDSAVSFVLPADAFTDVDGDALTLTAALSDGTALPAWLSFDAATRSFTGTPPLDFNGVLEVRVAASDGVLEISDTFALTVTPVNDAPVVSVPLLDQASAEDAAVNFVLPAGSFSDVDGDTLILTATSSDGTALPAWLSFDAVTRRFTGTPPSDFNGVLDIRVTASDGALDVSDSFALTITPVNDAPVVSTSLADQASAEDTAVNFALPVGAFADVDGDTLTLVAELSDGSALPAWLSFDAAARSFTGTPPLDFNGVLDVEVVASDGASQVSDIFTLTITPVNDAPVVSLPLIDQTSTEDTAVNFVLPAGTFTDVDGDTLSLTADLSDGSALPAWLSFDAAARSFTGTPPLDFNGVLDVRVTASDGTLEVNDNFALTITPILSTPLANQVSAEDTEVNFVLPAGSFTHVDGDALTLTATLSDGSALPVWLNFDATARSFAGTPPPDFNGVLDVRVTASDGTLEASDIFSLTIVAINDAPVVSIPLADQSSAEDTAVNFVLPAGTFTDVDGDALTLTAELSDGSVLPAWLSFNAVARSFTGTPPVDFNGALNVLVTASDGALEVSDSFALTVTPVNDAPVVSTPLADEASTEDSAVSFILPAGSFTDVDGDTLTLTATLSDGSALPVWLNFDATARSFAGTPPPDFNGVLDVQVTASDGTLEASDIFSLTIAAINDAPVVSIPLADQSSAEDTAVNFVLPAGTFTDVDGDALVLTAELSDGSALPAWLNFDAAARSFSGMPPLDFNGVLDVRVTASDGMLEASDIFSLTIAAINDAPVVSIPLADQSSAEDTAVNFVLPADAFADVDDDALELTAELSDGSALPAWLNFDAAARSFSGMPPLDFNGVLDVRVTASDGALEVSDSFALTVTPVNDAPVAVSDGGFTTDEDTAVTIPASALLANDTDIDGNTLVIQSVQAGINGTVALDDNGDVVFTPTADYSGPASFIYTISDGNGETSTVHVDVTINPVNDAPVVRAPLVDQTSAEDTAVSFVLPIAAFADVDGDTLILTATLSDGTALPAWLSFDAVARSFTGTPPPDFNGVMDVRVTASDDVLEVSDTFALTITPENDAPVVSTPLTDQTSAEDTAVNFVLPANSFADVDGDALTLTAALSDGTALPAWLSFDVAVRRFTGTPPIDFNGVLDVQVTASDGALEESDTFALTITPVNDAPVAVTDGGLTTDEDTAFTVPASALLANDTDVDGDTLVIQSVQAGVNGTVVLDANGDVVFTPTADYNGPASFTYTIFDGNGGTSTVQADVTVTPVNDTPIAGNPLADKVSGEDLAVNFILPADSFSDVDGDALTLTAALSDGTALPAWLNFDVATRSFTGTPPLDFNGVLDIRVTASDGAQEVSDSFALTITPVNDAPVVNTPLVDQTSAEDTAVNFVLPAGSFSDVDGDALTLAATLSDGSALPIWLSFDAATRSFTGTPPLDFNGVLDFRVTASDGALEVIDSFALTITPENDAPVVNTLLADQTSAEDTAVNFALPAGVFADVDGDALTLTAELSDGSALPAWLSFDAGARSFTGTPPSDFNGVLDVWVTALDGALEASDTFALTITPVNDAPVLSVPLVDQASAEESAVSFVLPADSFTDVDGDALTLTADLSDGSALPAWLSFDAATRSFTGTPPLDFNGLLDVRVTASDGALGVSDTFTLTITPVNDAPVVSVPLLNQASAEDAAVNFVLPAGSFSDVDGDALTLAATLSDGTALPAWLSFDAVAHGFTGTPPSDFNGVLDIRVTASDGALEVSDDFALTITPVNDAPVVSVPLVDQGIAEDTAVNFTLPAGAFADVDGDTLTLTAALSDASALPAWLSFDAAVRSFTGTPPLDFNGVLDVRVTASDGSLEVSDTFALTITPENDAPVVSTPLADQASAEDAAVSFILPAGSFTDADSDALTLTATLSDGSALPAWLSFDAVTRSFTGTPPSDFNGVLDVRVTASDGALEVSDTFTLAITPVNDAAVLSLPPIGEVQVNSHTTDQQIDSAMATLADGGWVVSWMSNDQDGSGYGIYAQRYDASGIAVGGEVQVNSHTESSQSAPSIAALADGGWFVSWTSSGQDGSGAGVYGQRYDAAGLAVGSETLINTHTTSQQQNPSVAGLSDGGWVVSWMSLGQDGNSFSIHAQRYDAAGSAVGGEVQVNTTTVSAQAFSSVTDLSDGGFVVSWTSYVQDGDSGGIYLQRYDAVGTAVGGEVQVNTTTASLQTMPTVTDLTDGGFVVSWTSYNQDGNSGGIYLQRYDAAGSAVGGEVQVNTHTAGSQTGAAVTGLSGGGFAVSWSSAGQDGSSSGVYLQLYDAAGNAVGGEVQVNSHTEGNQNLPVVAAMDDGGFAVSWTSYGQDGNGNGIFQKLFNADGSERSGPEYVENGAAVALAPGLVIADIDSTSLAGATVAVTDYVAGEDVLSFADRDGITGAWDAATGALTLTGAATLAAYETALRSVTYANTSDAPTGTSRAIAFRVDDGGAVDNLSAPVNAEVTITAVNDPVEIVGIAGVSDFLDATPDNDVFVFKPGFGQDLVAGFEAGAGTDDVLQLENLGYTNLVGVLEDAEQFGTDTVITTDDSNSITLIGVNMADLHDDDFQFVG